MAQASALELLMLDLVNDERVSRGLEPLRINSDLNQSAEGHSEWMLDTDTFNHTGDGGSSSNERIREAGYALEGSWRTAENIGWQSERGDPGFKDDVADVHESLMNSAGHRDNILDPNFEEIGIGVERGDFTNARGTFDGVMITQNFGTTDAEEDVLVASMEAQAAESAVDRAGSPARDIESDAVRRSLDVLLDSLDQPAVGSDCFVFI
ncbi:MAG: CAP domain-containing protein [Alteraurantiacibacter sp.]